jgi:integral membrane sensor domain MASE1
MTRGDLGKMEFLDRPVKPLVAAIALSVAALFWFTLITPSDPIAQVVLGDIVGALAGASLALLVFAWWFRSQSAAEIGLLLATFVWVTRAALIAVVGVSHNVDVGHVFWYSLAWAIAAGGAYLLESWDGKGGLCATFRHGGRRRVSGD